MKMVLKDGKEFDVVCVIDIGNNTIEIGFNGHSYDEVAKVYDKTYEGNTFNEDNLRQFQLFSSDDVLQGTHIGYTVPKSILSFEGSTKVTIQKENELKGEVISVREDALSGMEATTEIFELVLMQEGVIASLEDRLLALENLQNSNK